MVAVKEGKKGEGGLEKEQGRKTKGPSCSPLDTSASRWALLVGYLKPFSRFALPVLAKGACRRRGRRRRSTALKVEA